MSLCRNYCYQSQTAVEILTLLVARGGNFLPTFSPSALDFKNTHYLCLTAPPMPLHIHLLQDKQCQKQEGKKIAGAASKISYPTQSWRSLVFSAELRLFGLSNPNPDLLCPQAEAPQMSSCVCKSWGSCLILPEVKYLLEKSPKLLLSSQPSPSLWSVPGCDVLIAPCRCWDICYSLFL